MNVGVIGLGKLGQPMVATFARAGHQVWVHDLNVSVAERVAEGEGTVDEPMLDEELSLCYRSLHFAATAGELVADTEMAFVIVPTPSLPDGAFSNQHIRSALKPLGEAIAHKRTAYTVVVCSTTMPGSMDGEIREVLEEASGKTIGHGPEHVGLVYSPQFIALGSVLNDMRCPDMCLIGSRSAHAGLEVQKVLRSVHEDPSAIHYAFLNPTEAEIVKIGVNTYITGKIAFANAVGLICSQLDADGYLVTRTIGEDSRIGKKYITAGGPYGGPCFPRDTTAFSALANQVGADDLGALAEATDEINHSVYENVADLALELAAVEGRRIVVLGVGYKPASPVIEEAFGVRLIEEIGDRGEVCYHDEMVELPGCERLGEFELRTVASRAICVVCQPDALYANLDYGTVIDVWGIVPDDNADVVLNYRGPNITSILESGMP